MYLFVMVKFIILFINEVLLLVIFKGIYLIDFILLVIDKVVGELSVL